MANIQEAIEGCLSIDIENSELKICVPSATSKLHPVRQYRDQPQLVLGDDLAFYGVVELESDILGIEGALQIQRLYAVAPPL
jgi:hypothetical protein